jgi:hypothetical protein
MILLELALLGAVNLWLDVTAAPSSRNRKMGSWVSLM